MPALKTPPPTALPAIDGLSMATTKCQLRYKNRYDLTLFALHHHTTLSALLTQNAVKGEPILWNQTLRKNNRHLARALLVVAGNANVQTGTQGRQACASWAQTTAQALGCKKHEVWLAATGVIGITPPRGKVERGVREAAENLKSTSGKSTSGKSGWSKAARSILTTDTVTKTVGRKIRLDKNNNVNLAVIAKGSGMIAPNMATMLCFAFTDAKLAPAVVRQCLREAATPFSEIDVDGYPSTSDMITLAATQQRGPVFRSFSDKGLVPFRKALCSAFEEIALAVVADGEGAQRVVELRVVGAKNKQQAERVVRALALAPLVRTALAGADPNWGRITQTAGAVDSSLVPSKLSVHIGTVPVCKHGTPYGGAKNEARAKAVMRGKQFSITLDLGTKSNASARSASARRFVCDLTKRYVEINASYRT